MLKSFCKHIVPATLLVAAVSASAQSTVDITIQRYSNTQSTFSWTAGGSLAGGGVTVPATNNVGGHAVAYANLGGYFTGALNTNSLPTAYIPVTGFGSLSNLNTTASEPLGGLLFENIAGNTDAIGFLLGNSYPGTALVGNAGDQLLFTETSGSVVINVPITDFNPGTYEYSTPAQAEINPSGLTYFTTSITANLDILEPTPEPSILALGALGIFGGWMLRRRVS